MRSLLTISAFLQWYVSSVRRSWSTCMHACIHRQGSKTIIFEMYSVSGAVFKKNTVLSHPKIIDVATMIVCHRQGIRLSLILFLQCMCIGVYNSVKIAIMSGFHSYCSIKQFEFIFSTQQYFGIDLHVQWNYCTNNNPDCGLYTPIMSNNTYAQESTILQNYFH